MDRSEPDRRTTARKISSCKTDRSNGYHCKVAGRTGNPIPDSRGDHQDLFGGRKVVRNFLLKSIVAQHLRKENFK